MLARKFMTSQTKTAISIIVVVFILCVALMCIRTPNNIPEGFQNDPMADFETQIAGLDENKRRTLLDAMRDRLIHYGMLPNHGENEVDRTQWVPKSNIPPAGPRIDMSQYVKKSSIPPEKVCPPQQQVDMTQYVKKSTLPPAQKCPPCVAPKVKVSAAMCTKCPDCPKCPPPERCPDIKCPPPPTCPPPPKCPEMKCPPEKVCPECSRIKYIKVPTVITRTVYKDKDGNTVGEDVNRDNEALDSGLAEAIKKIMRKASVTPPPRSRSPRPSQESSTRAPTTYPEGDIVIPVETRERNDCEAESCRPVGLNSAFREFGVYGF